MQYSWCKILLMAAALCLTASVSQAAVGHEHHSQTADSPFLSQHDAKKPHCVLLGHSMDKPCPHIMGQKRERTGQTMIANDCGGGPLQAPFPRSGGDSPRYLVPVALAEDDLPMAVSSLRPLIFFDSLYFHSLDRPPRAL